MATESEKSSFHYNLLLGKFYKNISIKLNLIGIIMDKTL